MKYRINITFGVLMFLTYFNPTQSQSNIEGHQPQSENRFEPHFQSKYSTRDFQYKIPKTSSKKDLEWARFLSGSGLGFMKIILYLALLVGVVVVVKGLLKRVNPEFKNQNLERNVLFENGDKEFYFSDSDLEALINQHKTIGNFRWVLRYYFIKILRLMSEKDIISWHADKTNLDYKNEINSGELAQDFAHVAHIYEYVWYGEMALDIKDFIRAENLFLELLRVINRDKEGQ